MGSVSLYGLMLFLVGCGVGGPLWGMKMLSQTTVFEDVHHSHPAAQKVLLAMLCMVSTTSIYALALMMLVL